MVDDEDLFVRPSVAPFLPFPFQLEKLTSSDRILPENNDEDLCWGAAPFSFTVALLCLAAPSPAESGGAPYRPPDSLKRKVRKTTGSTAAPWNPACLLLDPNGKDCDARHDSPLWEKRDGENCRDRSC